MKIKTISYGRTLSDKDFGSFRADCTAELSEGDCVQSCMNEIKKFVVSNLNEDAKAAKNPKQTEMPIEREMTSEEAAEDGSDSGTTDEPVKKVTKKVAKKAAKKVAKKAVKKAAFVKYDRELKVHKEIFLDIASKLGLRKPKMEPHEKVALKATSLGMEGKDMFEAGTTNVITEFKNMAQQIYMDNLEVPEEDV